MFEALVHGKIDTEDLRFEPVIEDVETLNRMAFEGKLDCTKLSYHAFLHLTGKYRLLNSGSALGFNCGPLLIALPEVSERIKRDSLSVSSMKAAIPGKNTTANLLLSLAYPLLVNKKEFVFSQVEQAVLRGECELGLIIHENRFTYEAKGLKKVLDLGEWWEKESKSAIPLGGIVVDRNIRLQEQVKINELIKKSIEYAFSNRSDVMPWVKEHAQEMNGTVMKQHIDLYVNQYSLDLGKTGKEAVLTLFAEAMRKGIISGYPTDLFVL